MHKVRDAKYCEVKNGFLNVLCCLYCKMYFIPVMAIAAITSV